MQQIKEIIKNFEIKKPETSFKTRRQELISLMVSDINKLREGTVFKPTTEKLIALKINSNPFFKDLGELELVYKNCHEKRNYAHFFWLTKNK
jgi:hypothetical protein